MELAAYYELQSYTLTLGDRTFIHQHVVDAWMAQHADESTKPIGLTFALVGLCLHLDHGFSGREVQLAHMAMAKRGKTWPSFLLPSDRGVVTAQQVMAAPAGADRHEAIDGWCASVWDAYTHSHQTVQTLLQQHAIVTVGGTGRNKP